VGACVVWQTLLSVLGEDRFGVNSFVEP